MTAYHISIKEKLIAFIKEIEVKPDMPMVKVNWMKRT